MDHKELLKKYLEKINEGDFYSKEFENISQEFHKIADLDIGISPLIVACEVYYVDKNIPDETVYLGAQKAARYRYDNQLLDPDFGEANAYSVEIEFCLTENLETIIDEVKEQYQIVANEGVAEYFLINPRKDVVEWALEHKDELGFNYVEPEFVEKYQAIPELKELILNTLELKGE